LPRAPTVRRPASRWLRILGASALCVALLAAGWTYAVGHWLPEFLRPRIEAAGSQALGAPLRLGRLAIAPWTLEVRADGLQVGPAAAPWLAVAQITTALAPGASLWHFAPVLRRLEVRSPQVTIERLAPGRYNISPLLDALTGERAQGAGAPLRFELRDLSVVDGGLRLIDRVGGRTQRIEALQLRVPELRSPPVQGQEETALVVDARVDGSTVRVEGHSRALLPDRGTTLALRLQQFDLARALADAAAWTGRALPVSLQQGRLDAALQIEFALPPAGPRMRVSGKVDLAALQGRSAAFGLSFGSTKITLDGLDVQPFEQRARIGSVDVAAPDLGIDLALAMAGQNGAQAAVSASPAAPVASAAPAAPAASAASASTQPTGAWRWQVDRIASAGGRLLMRHPAWPDGQRLSSITLQVEGLGSGDAQTAPAKFALGLADARGAQVKLDGRLALDTKHWAIDADLARLQPAPWLQPWASVLPLRVVGGTVSSQAHVEGQADGVTLSKGKLQLDGVDLAPSTALPAKAAPQQDRLRLAKGSFDDIQAKLPAIGPPAVSVRAIALDGLDFTGSRAAGGRIGWLPAAPSAVPSKRSSARPSAGPSATRPTRPRAASPSRRNSATPHGHPTPPATAAPTWQIDELRCRGCALRLTDLDVKPAARLALTAIDVQARGLSSDPRKTIDYTLAAKLGARGRLAARGQARPTPLALRSRIDVADVDLSVLQPYLDPYVNLTLRSALASANGDLRLAGDARRPLASAHWQGRVAFGDVVARDRLNSAPFLRFQRVSSTDGAIDWRPEGYDADLGTVAIEGFYGRIILNADGRLNLNDIVRRGERAGVSLTTPSAAAPTPAPPAAAAAPSGPATTSAPASAPPVRWRAIHVARGEVDFTDLFIRPNYSARLTGISGDVSALALNGTQTAQVDLEGKVDDNAPVTVRGTIGPPGAGLSADIRAQARGIDLTRLTAYATRYAGYGIEKGTLSADVHYRIDAGRLTADNRLVLDQLTFGSQKVEGPDVLKLPVLLAVSLLKDANGVIDVELPISGSLNDPQFSVGGVIARVVINLIARAVTAPFRLLANAFGDGQLELSHVVFAPGSAAIDAAMKPALDTLAKALADRPALRLEITGRVDPAADTAALARAYVERLLRQTKARATQQPPREVTIAAADRHKWFEAAVRAAQAQGKVRAGGSLAALSDVELEALLLPTAPDGGAALATLANQRADGVKAYLATTIAPERLLVTASKLDASGITDKDGATRADFKLQ